ncbi:MAG: glutathione synthase [Deltaproteobacteria bacterium]|nr:glutathione synthase [Deltaproteobacteria bacterium]
MDPIESIRVDKDSTFALMLEAQRRGHEVLYGLVEDLYMRKGVARSVVRTAHLEPVQGAHARLGEPQDMALADADIVWMRKDPPFDMGYIFNTYLLDLAAQQTLVVNHPAGLRAFNEKAWAMAFPALVPESLITQDQPRLRAFADELGAVVVKPLDGNGGEGVFVLRSDDPNIGVILETSTRHGRRKVLAQRYLPEARQGDKRVIVIDGEPRGACLRVPSGVDHRGNIHAGARVVPAVVDDRDREICAAIGPMLRDAGQIFVGIDVIGGWLTEVNVTSPTCLHEIDAFDRVNLEGEILDAALARRRAS